MSKLKRRILKCGLKQIEVSRQTGIKYKTVNRQCIKGIRTARVAKAYAAVLQCNPLDLIEI